LMTTTDLIQAYIDVWNEHDPAIRETLMKSVLTEDSFYADPDYAGLHGHTELSEPIGRPQPTFGDLRFTLHAVMGVHHDRALFRWRLGDAATGYDVAEFTGARISSIVGFFA